MGFLFTKQQTALFVRATKSEVRKDTGLNSSTVGWFVFLYVVELLHMTQQTETKSNHFVLIIDEDRCEALQLCLTSFNKIINEYERDMPERAKVMLPVLLDFTKEISEKMHEHGWCKDEACEHNK